MFGANLKSVIGGELKSMTNLLRDAREQEIERMVEEAEARGADAIIAARFDVSSMGETAGWTEICAYGTAVRAKKLPHRQRRTSARAPYSPAPRSRAQTSRLD